jgi:O-antigen ligase
MCFAVAAFAIYAIVRYRTAEIEYVARLEIIRILVYAFVFFVIVGNLHGKQAVQWFVYAILTVAVALSFYAIYQFTANSDRVLWAFKPYAHRGSGTYISPNHLAGFLEMLLPLAVSYTLVGRTKVLSRIFLGYAALAILAGIAVTVSRGAWIATVFSLILLFGFLCAYRAYRLPAFIFFACILAATAYLAPKSYFFQKRTTGLFSNGRLDDDARFALWEPAFRIWGNNLWCGAGPAHFDREFRAYRPEAVQLQPEFVHNDFLNTLTDYGIAGAAIIVAALALLFVGIWKTWRVVRPTPLDIGDSKRSNKFAFLLGASCGLAALLAHSAVDFNMHIPANALLAVALMAWLTSHTRFATDRYWFTVRPWGNVVMTLILVAVAGYLTWQACRHAAEIKWLRRATMAATFSTEEVGFLKNAFAAEPRNPDTAYHIGEGLRHHSQEGGQFYEGQEGLDWHHLGEEAMQWFERTTKLDPWHAYGYLGQGWCLDWLEKTNESPRWFARAETLDPNGYYMVANIGVHYVQTGDYAAARSWFERSLTLQRNITAINYLQVVNSRLADQATNLLYQPSPP